MKKIFIILVLCMCLTQMALADYLVVHKATGVIRAMTTDNTVGNANFELVDKPVDFTFANGHQKVVMVGQEITIEPVTKQDKIAFLDAISPNRVKIRTLRLEAIKVWQNTNIPLEMREVIRLLAEMQIEESNEL